MSKQQLLHSLTVIFTTQCNASAVNAMALCLAVCMFERTNLTENKPPPIRMIRISDFGLPDPKRDPDRHQNCITWSLSHALPLHKISSKSVHEFASNPTDKQTNRPHRKHNLLLSAEVTTVHLQAYTHTTVLWPSWILYSSCVQSSMLHGSETWPVRKENEVALQQAEMRIVRWMCSIKLQDRVPSKGLRERLGLDDIISVLQQNRL